MRTLVIFLLAAVIATGCLGRQAHPRRGGEKEQQQEEKKREKETATPREVAGALLHALRDNQVADAWRNLSREARARLGPEERDFADKQFATLREQLGDWKEYRVLRPDDTEAVAVVMVTREQGVAAFPLRREEGEWKVEAGVGPKVTPVLPEPDKQVSGKNLRLAHRVSGGRETVKEIWTWLDGKLLTLHGAGAYDTDISSSAELRDGLDEGDRHVVVLARDGKGNLGAGAWRFRVKETQ